MGIAYDANKVREHLIKEQVWPSGDAEDSQVAYARDWWIGLLKQVTYGVNDHPWDETEDMNDAMREITEIAVDQVVGAAYVHRSIMYLLHLSDIDKLDVSDEVEIRLHTTILNGGDGTEGVYPRSGERYDDPDYLERKEEARRRHTEEINELLELGSVCKIYLESAAVTVARPWCEAQVNRYLTQWICERCEETFASEDAAEGEECDGVGVPCHGGPDHDCDEDDEDDCSFPHSLVKNDAE